MNQISFFVYQQFRELRNCSQLFLKRKNLFASTRTF